MATYVFALTIPKGTAEASPVEGRARVEVNHAGL